MKDKFMAVPQSEMLEIVEKMNSMSYFVEEVMADYFTGEAGHEFADRNLLSFLAEYFSGCSRVKEMVLEILLRSDSHDLKGQKIPENSVVVPDSEYLLLNNLLVGMLSLQIYLLDKNISLSVH